MIFVEQAFEEVDGSEESIVEGEQDVDVVEVFVTVEAVSEIVSRVDGGLAFRCNWCPSPNSDRIRGRIKAVKILAI